MRLKLLLKIKPKTLALYVLVLGVILSNYQLAKLGQKSILALLPNFSYIWSLSLPWLAIGLIPVIVFRLNLFYLDLQIIRKNIKEIFLYSLIVLIGLALFINLGITSYFHSVKYPFIFFIITPIVEELIFRGWMYDLSKKITKISPILITAILFGLHHFQYFGYRITPFAIFQIAYTFILGLLFGKMREKSGGIYLSTLLHIIINYVSYRF